MFQSSSGAENRHGAGEIDGLARTEELLDASGATVLHLRLSWDEASAIVADATRIVVLRCPAPLL